jgi:hypothetical protein
MIANPPGLGGADSSPDTDRIARCCAAVQRIRGRCPSSACRWVVVAQHVADVIGKRPSYTAGLMFWLWPNRFVGSYVCFNFASRW